MKRTLILGGTTEASLLATEMARRNLPAILSYAGRVERPRAQAVPTRIGGFGGAEGLAAYLRAEDIGQIVDATHPFAARISANALQAAMLTGTDLCSYERPAWRPEAGEDWISVPDITGAVAALAGAPARVFLAIGRLHLAEFAGLSQHDWLVRVVDAPTGDFPLPSARIEVARGPFDLAGDLALMRDHGTEILVAKNAGGSGASAKIAAARQLGLKIIMIERPEIPQRLVLGQLSEVMGWLHARLGV